MSNIQTHLEKRHTIGDTPGNPASMPGMLRDESKNVLDKYRVKYIKADVDDEVQMGILCQIETRSLQGKPGDEEIILLDKASFTFMDKYFIILKYLEKT